MKVVIQRVKEASVTVDNKIVGKINNGFAILVGIKDTDTTETADNMVKKIINLRIFEDENGKMNLSLNDIKGEILVVSQFTLYANCEHGNRPSFIEAGKPDYAKKLYDYMVQEFKKNINKVETGIFGADMKVSLINDGPVTIILEK